MLTPALDSGGAGGGAGAGGDWEGLEVSQARVGGGGTEAAPRPPGLRLIVTDKVEGAELAPPDLQLSEPVLFIKLTLSQIAHSEDDIVSSEDQHLSFFIGKLCLCIGVWPLYHSQFMKMIYLKHLLYYEI